MTKAAAVAVVLAMTSACASETVATAPPAAPQMGTDGRWIVSPKSLGELLAGDREVTPDSDDKGRLLHSSTRHVRTAVKFCVDETGAVQEAVTVIASPLPKFDAIALRHVRAWRFHPYLIDGKPAPVCAASTFLYTQN
jgi:TonB family protein